MFNINDIKNGITFLYEDNIYQVLEFLHVKPGKGAAFVKAKIKNLRTGANIEITFNSGIKIPTAHIDKQKMQYLYQLQALQLLFFHLMIRLQKKQLLKILKEQL